MYYKITYWKGRLGNNICQIIHIIIAAKLNNVNIIIPNHDFFDCSHIILFKKLNNENIIIKDKQNQIVITLDNIREKQYQIFGCVSNIYNYITNRRR